MKNALRNIGLTIILCATVQSIAVSATATNPTGAGRDHPDSQALRRMPATSFPATITLEPVDQVICGPGTVTFRSNGGGDTVLTIQWQYRENDYSVWQDWVATYGADSLLTFNADSTYDGYQFRVLYSNSSGSDTSATATLVAGNIFTVDFYPPEVICENQSMQLMAWTYPTAANAYLEKLDPGETVWETLFTITGATSYLSFDTDPIDQSLTGTQYRWIGSNGCMTDTSMIFTLTDMNPSHLVATHPANQYLCAPQTVTLSSTGNAYQWVSWLYRTDSLAAWQDWTLTSGTDSVLVFYADTTMNGYQFCLVMYNMCAADTTNIAAIHFSTPPVVTYDPITPFCEGTYAEVYFYFQNNSPATAILQAMSPGSVIWEDRDTVAVNPGGDSFTFVMSAVAFADSGTQVRMICTDGCAADTSDAVTIVVIPLPVITVHPSDQTVCSGQAGGPYASPTPMSITASDALFTAAAARASSVQWEYRVTPGNPWQDWYGNPSDQDTLIVSGYSWYNGYEFRAKYTNGCGDAYTDAAVLTVRPAVEINLYNPEVYCEGESIYLYGDLSAPADQAILFRLPAGATQWDTVVVFNPVPPVPVIPYSIDRLTQSMFGDSYMWVAYTECSVDSSDVVVLDVIEEIKVTPQPVDVFLCGAGTASFNSGCYPTEEYPYIQWYYRDSPTGTWYEWSGGNDSLLTVSVDSTLDGYQFFAEYWGMCGVDSTDIATLHVGANSDIGISIAAAGTAYSIGTATTVPYTVTIQNLGAGTASDVSVTDILPANLDWVSVDWVSGLAADSVTGTGSTRTLHFSSFPVAGTSVYTFNTTISCSSADSAVLGNTVTLTVGSGDCIAANDTANTFITAYNTPPVFATFPADVNVSTGAGATICGAAVSNFGSYTTSDNCPGETVSITGIPSGNIFPVGTTTLTYTVTDTHGATEVRTQLVTVTDNTPPLANTATLATVTGECSVTIASAPTANDNCAGTVTGTTADPLTYSTQGTHTITWTYSDGNGNTSTQTQTLIVDDVTAPVPDVATLPAISGQCSATIAAAPTATDNCAGTMTGTTTSPLTYSSQGTYSVLWTYDDGNGNTSTQTQTVVVRDITPPIVTCPPGTTVEANANNQAVVPNYIPGASAIDNCTLGGNIRFSQSPAAGSLIGVGNNPITISAMDEAENTSSCIVYFNVIQRVVVSPSTTPNDIRFGCNLPLTFSRSVTIGNSGGHFNGGQLQWTAVSGSPSVILTTSSGLEGGTLAYTVKPNGLTQGSHTFNITITAWNNVTNTPAANSPFTLPVNVLVEPVCATFLTQTKPVGSSWVQFTNSIGQVYAEVKSNGANIPAMTVKMYPCVSPPVYPRENWIRRYFQFEPSSGINVDIRGYYTDTETKPRVVLPQNLFFWQQPTPRGMWYSRGGTSNPSGHYVEYANQTNLSGNWMMAHNWTIWYPKSAGINVTSASYQPASSSISLEWNSRIRTDMEGFSIERCYGQDPDNSVWQEAGFAGFNERGEYVYTEPVEEPGTYHFRIVTWDYSGNVYESQVITINTVSQPGTYNLSQNYPNPFNPETVIAYTIPVPGNVTLKIYDSFWREISTLVDAEKPAGTHEVRFNAAGLPSGTYFYRLQSGSFVDSKKMNLIK